MLDYSPEKGKTPGVDIVHGAIGALHKEQTNTVRGAVSRRLNLGGAEAPNTLYAVVLPPDAADCLNDLEAILASYEHALINGQRDLLTMSGLRFDHATPLHRQFELGRRLALRSFAEQRSLASIIVQHVPSRIGFQNKPHVHIIAFARTLHGSNWGAFTELRHPGAKAILAQEWANTLGEA